MAQRWVCSNCNTSNRIEYFRCSSCNRERKKSRQKWESSLKPQMRVDVMDTNECWFSGVITQCSGDDLTILIDGWSIEFNRVVDRHSDQVMPFRSHSVDDRQSNSLQLLQPRMSVYIRSGIGNGQLWHRVQLQSVDFAARECTLADGPITISHYPIDVVSIRIPPNATVL